MRLTSCYGIVKMLRRTVRQLEASLPGAWSTKKAGQIASIESPRVFYRDRFADWLRA